MGLCLTGSAQDVADVVFLTNDSVQVEWIADHLLTDVTYYNDIRNMRGCTGCYQGNRVSVQGIGIGPVNANMYAVELMNEFGVKRAVKIDGCKALRADIRLGDMLLPQTAHTTSAINKRRFAGATFPAAADFGLLNRVYDAAKERGPVYVGPVVSIEHRGEMEAARRFGARGTIGMDMEMNQVFTAAQRFHIPCVGILAVMENMITGESMSVRQREKTFEDLARFALDTAATNN